MQIKPLKYN